MAANKRTGITFDIAIGANNWGQAINDNSMRLNDLFSANTIVDFVTVLPTNAAENSMYVLTTDSSIVVKVEGANTWRKYSPPENIMFFCDYLSDFVIFKLGKWKQMNLTISLSDI